MRLSRREQRKRQDHQSWNSEGRGPLSTEERKAFVWDGEAHERRRQEFPEGVGGH